MKSSQSLILSEFVVILEIGEAGGGYKEKEPYLPGSFNTYSSVLTGWTLLYQEQAGSATHQQEDGPWASGPLICSSYLASAWCPAPAQSTD